MIAEQFLLLAAAAAGRGTGIVRRRGRVVAQGRALIDDDGAFRPLAITCFPLVWGVRHDRERFEANVEEAATYGVHAPRILGEVGGTSWEDRVIDPLAPTYEEDLAAAIELNTAHGMRTLLSIFGGGVIDRGRQADVDRTVEKVIAVVRPRLEQILAIEIANEDNFPGDDADVHRVARLIRSALPSVVLMPFSPGYDEHGEQKLAYGDTFIAPDACNAQNLHQDRTPGDLDWRQARQLWGINYPYPLGALEPMGVKLMQGEDLNDPVRLAFCRAVGLFTGFQIFTLHCGPGVRLGGQYDVNMGRAANYWENPEIAACARMLNVVERLVPLHAGDWIKTSQHGRSPFADNPLYADAIWSDDGETHGVSRHYVAYHGREFVGLSYGVKEWAELIARRTIDATLFDLRAETFSPLALMNGERETLGGDGAADPAYVIVGTQT